MHLLTPLGVSKCLMNKYLMKHNGLMALSSKKRYGKYSKLSFFNYLGCLIRLNRMCTLGSAAIVVEQSPAIVESKAESKE